MEARTVDPRTLVAPGEHPEVMATESSLPMADQSVPDFYADGVAVGAGVYGFTVTFLLSQPMRPVGDSGLPGQPVAHVRVSPQLAKALADGILQSLESLPEPELKVERA